MQVSALMTKAVFTTKVTPSYKDLPEERYHFPHTYLNYVQQATGDYIVYYEPRRSSAELSSRGGRQSYFGVARVASVTEDAILPGHYFANIDRTTYLDFDTPVPFQEGGEYYESALEKDDGSTNKGAFGRAVRLISDGEFDRILKSGFAPVLGEALSSEAAEPGSRNRHAVRATNSRNNRLSTLPRKILHAQCACCLFEPLCDYRFEIDQWRRPSRSTGGAHSARSIEGPDSVRNGLALSGTVHWMFDRGLISISDDFKILVAKNHVPEDAVRLLNQSGMIHLPKDQTLHPNEHYLKFHRDLVFKG